MPSFQLIDKLLECSLFQGMSKSDLHEIIGQTKFDFAKYEEGKTIVKSGDNVEGLIFLLNGTVEATTESVNHTYRVIENINAPYLIQPQRLFGLRQQYYSSFRAHTQCNVMMLNKREVMKLIEGYEVFRINFINLYATGIQHLEDRLWGMPNTSLRSHLIRFFATHALRPAGEKTIKIKMTTLAEILNDSRTDISRALNAMQSEGLVNLSRGAIHIPALEALFV